MRTQLFVIAIVAAASSVGCPVPPSSSSSSVSRRVESSTIARDEPCYKRAFHKVAIEEAVNPNVVRIVADGALGTAYGTGFVVATQNEDLAIVTNEHVVRNAEHLSALVVTPSGRSVKIADLQVCRDDHAHDLAILCTSRLPGGPGGLPLSAGGVHRGEDVAAIGYPPVAGSETVVSFESGEISALERVVDGRSYIQTNININAGNSGGPVVDPCGEVVGVVTAVSTEAQRIGLIVSVEHVRALYERYRVPQPPADVAIRARLTALEKAIRLQRGEDQAELFSRSFLVRMIVPEFQRVLQQSEEVERLAIELLQRDGLDYNSLPFKTRAQLLEKLLQSDAFIAWYLGKAVVGGIMGPYEAFHQYIAFSSTLPQLFGTLRSLRVLDITEISRKAAMARVEITNQHGARIYAFTMELEAGEWHVAELVCLNGCRG